MSKSVTRIRTGFLSQVDLSSRHRSPNDQIQGDFLGNYQQTELEYVDDTILIASSREEISDSLKLFLTEATKSGLEVNWTKTELMYVGEGALPHPINIMRQDIEFVDSFEYLAGPYDIYQ